MTRAISLWIGPLALLALIPNRLDAGPIPFAGEQIITDTAAEAEDVEVADLDADGDLDVIVAAASANMLAWYENLGDGTFAERVITLGLDGANDVEVGDLDGDGDLDLVATGGGQATVSRFLSVPTGPDPPSFVESAISATTTLPGGFDSVTLFDIEPDGDLDVAALGRDDQELVVYTQTTGSFSSPGPIAFAGVVEVSVGDRLRDGVLDIVVACESSQGLVLIPNARAIFWEDFERGDAAVWTAEVP